MNNACLIAACAISGINNRKSATRNKKSFNKVFDFYYKVHFKKTYYFEAMTLVTPVSDLYSACFADIPSEVEILVRPVKVPAETIAVSQTFPVLASKCKNGIDEYIKDNIDQFVLSSFWSYTDEQIKDMYVEKLNKKYNIKLDPQSVTYRVQYSWEIYNMEEN